MIALPLQGASRKYENSVFIDHDAKPFPDQWSVLSNTSKVDRHQFNTLLKTLSLKTSVDEVNYLPWENSNNSAMGKISDCPDQIWLRFENQLYIQNSNLPN